uniref:Sema domain-containing protein n=1 Tax=Amphiprion ocellaris TaxID=80972 RepID=A0AAQ5Z0H8_AMPOC
MSRRWVWQFALVALATVYLSPSYGKMAEFTSDTLINNVVAGPDLRKGQGGRLYVGAVNALYQLNQNLEVESRTETGPRRDNRQCTPPVTDACEEAVDTDNHNKLLLVHAARDVLVVCGSVFRGICSLRNLSNVEQLLYFSDTKGEKSYVASAEESVSVVGKGYGSHDSTKLISTRILQDFGDWVVFDSIIEASAVQANPFVLRYLHDFRFAFKDGGFVYFLFSRTLGVQDTKNFTFISRMCEDDQGYYSYTELQLNCSAANKYNKAQAAYVATPGEVLAQSMTSSGQYGRVSASDKVLFVTFTSDEDPSTSAMCMFPLQFINNRLVEIIGACYSHHGNINDKAAVYSPYSSKSEELCSEKPDMALKYKCGAEFLPSPLASKAEFALTVEPSLVRKGHMTAVAVAVEMEHAVAFLGTATGEVLKVHLSAHPEVYGRAPGEVTGDKVNKNLLFDADHQHLYITTEKKVRKRLPVQACHLKTDCHSCVNMKDPYCGWCVLEGRCTRKQDCSRSLEDNTWLWSPNQQCVQIQAFSPPNLSCRKTQQVGGSSLSWVHFLLSSHTFRGPVESIRRVRDQHSIRQVVIVLYLLSVSSRMTYKQLDSHLLCCRCISCVTSQWGCQWNTESHSCSDSDDSVGGNHIVKPQQPESCPQFESPEPLLIPVGFEIPISFQGRNLENYMFSYDKQQEVNVSFHIKQSDSEKRIDSTLTVVLYNCSVGREDCSLCKHADTKYQCVWCSASRTCVYRELCPTPQPDQCPDPEITDIVPRYGPLNGRISVTIKGSNMGIKKEDIRKITVARVDFPPSDLPFEPTNSGAVEVEVEGGRRGTSKVVFTYRDPKPTTVQPAKGPAAGGTVITIGGENLDTATKDDVTVSVGGFPCEVLSFGKEITCKTGRYRGQKVPSDQLTVTVKYGKNTTKDVPASGGEVREIKEKVYWNSLLRDTQTEFKGPVFKNRPAAGQRDGGAEELRLPSRPDLQQAGQEHHYRDQHHHRHREDRRFNLPLTLLFISSSFCFSKAMTAKEAQAFVGDASCHVNILGDLRELRHSGGFLSLQVKFGHGEWMVGSVYYARKDDIPLAIIIPAVIVPMLLFIAISVYCYRRKSQQAEREYEKVKHQLENLEESVRDRCKKEFTDLMIEMEDHTSDLSEGRIPFLDYKTYTDRNFFLPSIDGAKDPMITGRIQIPEVRRATVAQALNQFSNLLNSKTFLINFIRTLESRPDFNARSRGYFASLLTVALHGKLEYYTDIMRTLLLELMDEHVQNKNPKLMLRRSETVVERMLCNWMSICLYQFLRDTAGEPLYKLYKALKHQVEKGPVDAKVKKAKYTLNDTGLLGDDVEYSVLVTAEIGIFLFFIFLQVKEKIIDQVYRNLPYSQRPKVDSVALEWRPGSTGQILSDLDLTSQKEGCWKRLNTLAHYNVSFLCWTSSFHQQQDNHEEKNALLEDDNTFHLVRPADEIDEVKSKRGSMKDKAMTKAITEIYLTRLLSVKGTLQQFVDDFFRSVLCSSSVVPPAVKYFFDFLDEQALRHDNVEEETLHIWKTNSLPLRFWVNILRNPHFIFDVHVTEVVDASLHVIAQTFMDACTKTEHKLSRESPSNKLLYAKEISTYKKMVDDYYKGIRQMIPVSDQDMNTHLAEVSREHTDKLNTQVALHQLYQYASKYYDIIQSLDEDPAAQNKQLTLRLQQVAAALENKVTDL